jgi:hypothetical protein
LDPPCPTFQMEISCPENLWTKSKNDFKLRSSARDSRGTRKWHTAQVTNDPPLATKSRSQKNCRPTAAQPSRYRLLAISLDRHLECSPSRSSPRKHRRLVPYRPIVSPATRPAPPSFSPSSLSRAPVQHLRTHFPPSPTPTPTTCCAARERIVVFRRLFLHNSLKFKSIEHL